MSADAAIAETAPGAPRAARWVTRLDQWLDRASDYVNPILVKETRQALKSQQFVLWYMLLLAGCWVVTIGVIAMMGPSAYYAASGGWLYRWYFGMLAFPLLVVVPFSAFRSLASEQEDNTRDVLNVSALTPYQIVNGKLASAVLQMVIYASAIAPCLAFTYILRGVDALTIALLPAGAALASFGLSLITLLLASVSRQRYLQVLLSVGIVAGLLLVFWGALVVADELVGEGYRLYQQREFWVGAAAVLTLYATTALLAYFGAVAHNTFTSANRSTAIRVAVMIQQACFVGWTAGYCLETDEWRIILIAGVTACLYWYVVGAYLTGEEPALSPRVRRTLPKSGLGRTLFTWLAPGSGTGYFFAVANLTACVLLAAYGLTLGRTGAVAALGTPTTNDTVALVLLAAYVTVYLGVGRLTILALRKVADVPAVASTLVHFVIVLIGCLTPIVVRASSTGGWRSSFSFIDITNPFMTVTRAGQGGLAAGDGILIATLVGGAAACVLLVNLALAAREITQTWMPAPQRVIEDELLLHPAPAPKPTNPWGDTPED